MSVSCLASSCSCSDRLVQEQKPSNCSTGQGQQPGKLRCRRMMSVSRLQAGLHTRTPPRGQRYRQLYRALEQSYRTLSTAFMACCHRLECWCRNACNLWSVHDGNFRKTICNLVAGGAASFNGYNIMFIFVMYIAFKTACMLGAGVCQGAATDSPATSFGGCSPCTA